MFYNKFYFFFLNVVLVVVVDIKGKEIVEEGEIIYLKGFV